MDPAKPVIAQLREMGDPRTIDGLHRFGIHPTTELLGIGLTSLRRVARAHRRDHELALALWKHPIHEARHLAALVDDPAKVTKAQMLAWTKDFDSWDIVDGCCYSLFDRTPHAVEMTTRFASRKPEFQKRAAFAMIAGMAVHDKEMSNAQFRAFLPLIEAASDDDRNFVRKGVNWALRQIGKRNSALNKNAIAAAERIRATGTRAGRWIAADALRELRSDAVQARLGAKASSA
jgi:3-methyladenine DNA glycosylase AlkD